MGPYPSCAQCFEAAEQVEHLMRAVCVGLAVRYAGEPTKKEIFQGLADEEEQHAQRIRLLAKQAVRHKELVEAALASQAPP